MSAFDTDVNQLFGGRRLCDWSDILFAATDIKLDVYALVGQDDLIMNSLIALRRGIDDDVSKAGSNLLFTLSCQLSRCLCALAHPIILCANG